MTQESKLLTRWDNSKSNQLAKFIFELEVPTTGPHTWHHWDKGWQKGLGHDIFFTFGYDSITNVTASSYADIIPIFLPVLPRSLTEFSLQVLPCIQQLSNFLHFKNPPNKIVHIFTCSRIKSTCSCFDSLFQLSWPASHKKFQLQYSTIYLYRHVTPEKEHTLSPESLCPSLWASCALQLQEQLENVRHKTMQLLWVTNKKLLWVLNLSNYYYDVAANTEWTKIVQIHNERLRLGLIDSAWCNDFKVPFTYDLFAIPIYSAT
jgi:hypothetical protein